VPRACEPFNRPTNAALGPDGHLYVADGYVNAKVHVFTVGGEPVRSWGTRGSGPGQFQLVHDLAFHPDGRLFVADSDNERLQIFSPDGTYLGQWLDVQRPRALAVGGDGLVFIGEFPWAAGQTSARRGARRAAEPARLSIFTPDGELLARWGASPDDPLGGHLVAPHSLALDDEGSLYVAEVPASFLGAAAAATAPRLRKLRRL
jgi:sugar lactone lactonase YvrE